MGPKHQESKSCYSGQEGSKKKGRSVDSDFKECFCRLETVPCGDEDDGLGLKRQGFESPFGQEIHTVALDGWLSARDLHRRVVGGGRELWNHRTVAF